MTKCRNVTLAGLLLLSLAGCGGSAGGLLDFGGKDEKIIGGNREAVLPEVGGGEVSTPTEPLVIPAAVPLSAWTQPGGNAEHALGNVQLGTTLKRAWSANAGEGSNSYGRLTASPIADGSRIYVMDAEATVSAFNTANGKRVWSRSLVPDGEDERGGFGGGIATDGSRIYAVTAFGEAVALNAGDGKPVWRQKIDAPVRTAPTVADGKLYLVSVSNDVYALSIADGSLAWRYQGSGEQAAAVSAASPAVGAGIVLAPTTSGELVAIEAGAGMGLWSESLTALDTSTGLANLNDIAARPVLAGNTAFALSHAGRFAAFNPKTGERLWERDMAGTETPWVAGSALFVITRDGNMHAISANTGGAWWTTRLPAGTWAGPVLAGGRLIVASSTGELASFDPQSGQLVDSQDIGGKFYIAPIVAGGTLYLLSDNAELIAFR